MRRAYLIYFFMFAILACGMWLILTVGAAMRAPDDLSGDWTVHWDTSASEPMHIDQSGRFFVVRFPNKPPISMTLEPGWKGASDGRRLEMTLAGTAEKVTLSGDIPLASTWKTPQLNVQISGVTPRAGRAIRVGAEATTRPAGVARAR
jgi:hypothetical protein